MILLPFPAGKELHILLYSVVKTEMATSKTKNDGPLDKSVKVLISPVQWNVHSSLVHLSQAVSNYTLPEHFQVVRLLIYIDLAISFSI